ncbi:MAG: aspartate 1-decarboxylase [Planctomycetota bacterium]|jgi:aspartate 1-decarboxylase
MFIKVLKSKLHRATVTDTKLHYPGSLAIDSKLMAAADIIAYESVMVADLNNGSRFETYAVPAEGGSGEIVVLGAAAQLVKPKDTVIIFSFGYYTTDEARTHKPKLLVLDENNKIKRGS